MNTERPLSTLIIRDLMLEVIKNVDFCKRNSQEYSFITSRGGNLSDLTRLVEIMAIENGLIEKQINVSNRAWGGSGLLLCEGYNTNFNMIEIERLYEAFYILLNNYIIAPGMYGNSDQLPYFHVTNHGVRCVEIKDILPYDIDGYLNQLKSIPGLDEWVEFYMDEALRCFNVGCFNAATAMIGLSSEVIVEALIKEFSKLLGKTRYGITPKPRTNINLNGKTIKQYFDDKINKENKISKRYGVFTDIFDSLENLPEGLIGIFDKAARDTFFTFIRLNRNEVTHCFEVKKDMTETLLLFVTFIKYCKAMTNMLESIKRFNNG